MSFLFGRRGETKELRDYAVWYILAGMLTSWIGIKLAFIRYDDLTEEEWGILWLAVAFMGAALGLVVVQVLSVLLCSKPTVHWWKPESYYMRSSGPWHERLGLKFEMWKARMQPRDVKIKEARKQAECERCFKRWEEGADAERAADMLEGRHVEKVYWYKGERHVDSVPFNQEAADERVRKAAERESNEEDAKARQESAYQQRTFRRGDPAPAVSEEKFVWRRWAQAQTPGYAEAFAGDGDSSGGGGGGKVVGFDYKEPVRHDPTDSKAPIRHPRNRVETHGASTEGAGGKAMPERTPWSMWPKTDPAAGIVILDDKEVVPAAGDGKSTTGARQPIGRGGGGGYDYSAGGNTAEERAKSFIAHGKRQDEEFELATAGRSTEARMKAWIDKVGKWNERGPKTEGAEARAAALAGMGKDVVWLEGAAAAAADGKKEGEEKEYGLEEWLRYDSYAYGRFITDDLDAMWARINDPMGHWKPETVRSARYKRLMEESHRRNGNFWMGEITQRAGPMWDSQKREAWEAVEARLLKEARRRSQWWEYERVRRAREDEAGESWDAATGEAAPPESKWEAEMIAVQAELDRRWPVAAADAAESEGGKG